MTSPPKSGVRPTSGRAPKRSSKLPTILSAAGRPAAFTRDNPRVQSLPIGHGVARKPWKPVGKAMPV